MSCESKYPFNSAKFHFFFTGSNPSELSKNIDLNVHRVQEHNQFSFYDLEKDMAMKKQPQPDQSKDHDESISWTSGPLQCRLASADDYEEVLEMSKGIYNGYDYLPFVFHQWLEEPNRLVFVAQLEEKLVGLYSTSIISGGTSCTSQALRIHHKYRGKRLGSYLENGLYDYIRRNYPSVRRELYAIIHDSVVFAMHKGRGDRLILEQATLSFHVKKGSLKVEVLDEISRNLAVELKPSARQEFHDVLPEKARAGGLLPGGFLTIVWQPFESIRSNIDCIFKDGDHVLVDRSGGESFPKAVSHGRLMELVNGSFWSTTICTDDPVLLQANAVHQLKNACEVLEEDFVFYLTVAKEFQSLVKSIFQETLKLELNWDKLELVFEHDLSRVKIVPR